LICSSFAADLRVKRVALCVRVSTIWTIKNQGRSEAVMSIRLAGGDGISRSGISGAKGDNARASTSCCKRARKEFDLVATVVDRIGR
jgi:hypothetical protein